MEWWSGGGMEWWSGGVVEWWSGGVVERWSGGVEWWSGVVEWWSGGVGLKRWRRQGNSSPPSGDIVSYLMQLATVTENCAVDSHEKYAML